MPLKLWRFQKLLADNGVPAALCGERALIGVEKDCLAWITNGCTGGIPDLPVFGVWTLLLIEDCCRLLVGVDTEGYC